jgi:hypothetical protein
VKARWIRLGAVAQREFDATYAASSPRCRGNRAAPVLLWGTQVTDDAARYPFALVAPLKFAPGRPQRWLSWGLAAARRDLPPVRRAGPISTASSTCTAATSRTAARWRWATAR